MKERSGRGRMKGGIRGGGEVEEDEENDGK
jgi:hypothetical protein